MAVVVKVKMRALPDNGEGEKKIIYIMLLSDLEKLLSVWENVLSIANVT